MMINSYRTSLLNISGDNWPGLTYPGEELVDPLFAERKLPSYIRSVRSIIFGENPDRAYLNYRLKQITTLWHDSILNSYLSETDSRITYWPLKFSADMSMFGTMKVDYINSNSVPDYSYFSTPHADDKSGRAEFIYELAITGDTCVVLDERSKQTRTIVKSGSFFDLGYNAKLSIGSGNFRAVVFGKPQKDLGQILLDCDLILNSDIELLLFNNESSLKELWRTSEFLPERLGAISLALAKSILNIPVIKTT